MELKLEPVTQSALHARRVQNVYNTHQAVKTPRQIVDGNHKVSCERCHEKFDPHESMLQLDGRTWHVECFLCAQCMLPMANGTYYNFANRLYCERDFQKLYAPVCSNCDEFILGKVIRSLNKTFHASCFNCDQCHESLVSGAYIYDGRSLCDNCNSSIEKRKFLVCGKCKQPIEDDLLKYRDQLYHAYHFNCSTCEKTLDRTARELKNDLFCRRCFELKCETCADCREIIDPEKERSCFAMGKHYHLQHFRCAACCRPFNGEPHFELKSKPYCKKDYLEKTGNFCFYCNAGLLKSSIQLFGKTFCQNCYRCSTCDKVLGYKDKVTELDMKPVCKKCMSRKNVLSLLKNKS